MGKSLHRRLMDIARAQDDVTHLNEKGVKYFSECLQAIRVRDARIAAVEHNVKALVDAAQRLRDICHFLTIGDVIGLGDDAMIAAGLPLSIPDTSTYSEPVDLSWADAALAALDGKEEAQCL